MANFRRQSFPRWIEDQLNELLFRAEDRRRFGDDLSFILKDARYGYFTEDPSPQLLAFNEDRASIRAARRFAELLKIEGLKFLRFTGGDGQRPFRAIASPDPQAINWDALEPELDDEPG